MIQSIFSFAKPLGHNEDNGGLNLGFGFLYYGLVRALRPQHVMVIGSGFGFSVVCLALGLKDNARGRLTFIDPSYNVLKDGPFKTIGGRGLWSTPEHVSRHFERFGLAEIVTHYKSTSEAFFSRYEETGLPGVDVGFVDGNHAFKHVRHDFSQITKRMRKNGYILLHDTNIYFREVIHHSGVKRWLSLVKEASESFEVVDFPFSSGVAIVRVLKDEAWKVLNLLS
jgi:predicted O-methyltransferase YrrM